MKGKEEVNTKAEFSDILIDSLFYAFENFDQTFLTNEHLKGSLTGSLDITTPLKNSEIDYPSMLGSVKLTIKNGELNGFSPMQKLSRFVEEHELYNIRFTELSNEFFIRDNRLSFSEMRIKSNVSDINISGSHTLDNFLDYKLTVPLKNFKRKEKDKDASFGAIEDDGRGKSVLFLTLKGPAADFKIGYDTKRTTQKAGNDIRKELNEINTILSNPKRYERLQRFEQKDPQLNQEEYFNFD